MLKKYLSALTAVLLLTLGTGSARADHLTVAFAIATTPFVYQTETGAPRPGEAKGIELDIMKAALAPRGHTFTPLFTTYDGLQGEVLTGATDAAAEPTSVATTSVATSTPDVTTSPEIVSSDLVGASRAGVVDIHATIAHDNTAILYVWYDNEFGYSCQVVRILEDMACVNPPAFPG